MGGMKNEYFRAQSEKWIDADYDYDRAMAEREGEAMVDQMEWESACATLESIISGCPHNYRLDFTGHEVTVTDPDGHKWVVSIQPARFSHHPHDDTDPF